MGKSCCSGFGPPRIFVPSPLIWPDLRRRRIGRPPRLPFHAPRCLRKLDPGAVRGGNCSSMAMKNRKIWSLFALAIVVLLGLSFVVLRSRTVATGPSEQGRSGSPSPHQVSAGTPSATALPATASKSGDPESVEELSALVRKLAAQGGDANALYARIVPMQLPKQAWWVNASDFSSLLAVATDASVSDAGRGVALRLYLAGVPKAELEKQADSLQATFSGASDSLVGALLQDMADRQVSPRTLIQQTLTSPQREENTKCLAWYAARLTEPANPAFASIAISEAAGKPSISSKVALNYLAAAPHAQQLETDPASRKTLDHLVEIAMTLPVNAGIIETANSDAFITALPNIMAAARSKQTFLSLLHNAPNPEVRLSALEQIVKRHTSGSENLSAELGSIKKNIATLFPDSAKQFRANALLRRANGNP